MIKVTAIKAKVGDTVEGKPQTEHEHKTGSVVKVDQDKLLLDVDFEGTLVEKIPAYKMLLVKNIEV